MKQSGHAHKYVLVGLGSRHPWRSTVLHCFIPLYSSFDIVLALKVFLVGLLQGDVIQR